MHVLLTVGAGQIVQLPSSLELLFRVFVATICGAAIGLEREFNEKPAGLRTHALVACGAAAFSIAGFGAESLSAIGVVQLDISRIPAQVASGIGFLGAGLIIFNGDRLRGLTTAAELWTVAAIGVMCGLGAELLGACVTVLVLVIVIGGRPLERVIDRIRVRRHRQERQRRLFREAVTADGALGDDIPDPYELEDDEDDEDDVEDVGS